MDRTCGARICECPSKLCAFSVPEGEDDPSISDALCEIGGLTEADSRTCIRRDRLSARHGTFGAEKIKACCNLHGAVGKCDNPPERHMTFRPTHTKKGHILKSPFPAQVVCGARAGQPSLPRPAARMQGRLDLESSAPPSRCLQSSRRTRATLTKQYSEVGVSDQRVLAASVRGSAVWASAATKSYGNEQPFWRWCASGRASSVRTITKT